ALAGMSTHEAAAAGSAVRNPLALKTPHFAPRAKRIIFLYMSGGPTHVDTFDHKPYLFQDSARGVLRPPFGFRQYGRSGLHMTELLPNLGEHADDMCLINSMCTDVPNHPQSCLMLHTGEFRFTRPSMGSWMLYGLGTENQDLPGFVTVSPPTNLGGAQNYANAFLPAAFQATRIGYQGTPVAQARIGNLANPDLSSSLQRRQLDLLQSFNTDLLERQQVNTELEG